MNRRQLIFVVVLNALISLVVALAVAWAVEARRPDPETLAILATPIMQITTLPPVAEGNVAVTPGALLAEAADNSPDTTGETADTPPTAAAPTATFDPNNQQIYTIQSGDSLSAVADRYGTTVDAIMQTNELTDPNVVYIGQRLIIPVRSDNTSSAPTQPTGETPTAPLVVGEGMLIRTVDGSGAIVTEAVQIVNDSNTVVNLKGWRLERENGPAYTFGELSIFPGGNIWVHTATGNDTSVALYWDQTEPVWQTGTVARLLDTQGNVINSYPVP